LPGVCGARRILEKVLASGSGLRRIRDMTTNNHRSATLKHLSVNGEDALSVYALDRGSYELAIEADREDGSIATPARPKHNVYLESADFQTFSGGRVVR
jgi:hypothetical protein